MADIIINTLVLFAWGFLVWGTVKDRKARKPEYAKNRTFQVKTFWVLFFGSILWCTLSVINIFAGTPFLLEGFLTVLLGHTAYVLNKTIRTLK